VLLDADLALVYGVTTKRLNEQVRRNLGRFPPDFLFTLTDQELTNLRSHFATSSAASARHGGRRYRPLAFTEHGAVMVATILNSERAVEMSVYVVRAFVELRAALAAGASILRRLDVLEKNAAVTSAESRRQFKELRTLVFSLAMPPAKEQ